MRYKALFASLTAGLLIIGAAAVFAQTKAPSAQPATPEKTGPAGPGERLAKFLDLTPDQVAKLTQIRKAMREDRQAFREEMSKLRPQLREALKDPKADPKMIDSLIDQMSQLRAARMKSAIQSLRSMRSVLTPEQLAKFKQMRERMAWRRGFGRGFGFRRGMGPGWGFRPHRGFGGGFGGGFEGWL